MCNWSSTWVNIERVKYFCKQQKTEIIIIIIRRMPEQHTRKALNQGTTENGHTAHCTHTSESTNVKVQ
jgi:hypothetical protein